MSGGGGTTYSTGTQYTSDMPTWVQTPHMELIKWATDAARLRPFPTYEALDESGTAYAIPRIAQFDPLQVAAFGGRTDLYERGDPESAMAWGQFGNAGSAIGGMDFDYGQQTEDPRGYSAFGTLGAAPSLADLSPLSGFGTAGDFALGSMGYGATGYQTPYQQMLAAYNAIEAPGVGDVAPAWGDWNTQYGITDPTYGYTALTSAPATSLGAHQYYLPGGMIEELDEDNNTVYRPTSTQDFALLDYGINPISALQGYGARAAATDTSEGYDPFNLYRSEDYAGDPFRLADHQYYLPTGPMSEEIDGDTVYTPASTQNFAELDYGITPITGMSTAYTAQGTAYDPFNQMRAETAATTPFTVGSSYYGPTGDGLTTQNLGNIDYEITGPSGSYFDTASGQYSPLNMNYGGYEITGYEGGYAEDGTPQGDPIYGIRDTMFGAPGYVGDASKGFFGAEGPSIDANPFTALTDDQLPEWLDTRSADPNYLSLWDAYGGLDQDGNIVSGDLQNRLADLIGTTTDRTIGTPLTAANFYSPSDFSAISDAFRLRPGVMDEDEFVADTFGFQGRDTTQDYLADYGIGDRDSEYMTPYNAAMAGLGEGEELPAGWTSPFDFGGWDMSARDAQGNLVTDEDGQAQFTGDTYNQYIQSYMDSHEEYIRQLEDELEGQFLEEEQGQSAQAVASGSRGGYREALRKGTREAELQEAKADLRSREMAKAYDFAAQQFERDRRAGITGAQMEEDALRTQEQFSQSARDQDLRGRMFEEQMGAQEREFGARFGFDVAGQDIQNAMQLQQMSNQANQFLADLDMQADMAMQQGDFQQLEMINQDRQYYSNLASQYDFQASEYDMRARQLQQEGMGMEADYGLRAEMADVDLASRQAELDMQDRQFLADLQRQAAFQEQGLGMQAAQMYEESRRMEADNELRAAMAGADVEVQLEQLGAQERQFLAELVQSGNATDAQIGLQAEQFVRDDMARRAEMMMQEQVSSAQMGLGQAELGAQERQFLANLTREGDITAAQMALQAEQYERDDAARRAELLMQRDISEAQTDLAGAELGMGERQFLADLQRQYATDEARLELEGTGILEASKQAKADAELRGGIAAMEGEMAGAQLDAQERQYLADLRRQMAFQQMSYGLQADQMRDDALFRQTQTDMAALDSSNQARMQAAQQRMGMGQLASDLGTQYDARQLNRLREMERAGATRRELDQAVLDMNYENYMRRTNWAQDQLNWLQGVLSGAPAAQQTYTTAPGPSPVSELLGLGLAAGSVGNLFGGD
jgi:hypothetical protein